jgi:glycosyltransferase involved in cell wall biosynthesis
MSSDELSDQTARRSASRSVKTRPTRLAVFAASPVYYQAPLYRTLAREPAIDLTVIFASSEGGTRPFDGGYGKPVEWGVDALGGFKSVFLRNAYATKPSGFLELHDFDIVRELLRGGFDVVWMHGYNSLTHLLVATTQKVRRRPLLVREEQTGLSPRPWWKQALKQVGLRLVLANTYALYIGTNNRAWFKKYGVPEERMFFTPYVVDNDRLQRERAALLLERDRLRAQFHLPHQKPVIATVSRLIAKKQPLALLDAYRRVRKSHDCALLVVGSGELEDDLRREVERRRIPDVRFAGFLDQSQIAQVYTVADIFALVSAYDETWGLVVNEAMNFELPIVVSDRVGCAIDLVSHGENGFVVAHDDGEALAEALATLVRSPRLRARLGAASGERIRAWSYTTTAAGVLDAIAAATGVERRELASERITAGVA